MSALLVGCQASSWRFIYSVLDWGLMLKNRSISYRSCNFYRVNLLSPRPSQIQSSGSGSCNFLYSLVLVSSLRSSYLRPEMILFLVFLLLLAIFGARICG